MSRINKKKMKKTIWLILVLILLVNIVLAVENKVFIVDLNYKEGEIKINDIMTKDGYYPDRKLYPETGYTLELISEDNTVLYSFKFQVPLKIYTDVIDENGETKGGIIVLNETDFALIFPYYGNAKYVKIYDISNKEILSTYVAPALGGRTTFKWIFGFIIIIIVLFFFFKQKKPKRKLPQ